MRDDARDLWVIPAPARDNGDASEVSVSNGNAVALLLALGLAPEPYGLPTLDALSGLVTAALRLVNARQKWRRQNTPGLAR